MSLDVYLIAKNEIPKKGTGIFIRENGGTKELTSAEAKKRFPDTEIVEIDYEDDYVFDQNITHNLGKMASEAGLYEALWRPHRLKKGYDIPEDDHNAEWEFEDANHSQAFEIIPILKKGIKKMKSNPEYFKKFNPENGWGTYEGLLSFAEKYLEACKEYPNSFISVSR